MSEFSLSSSLIIIFGAALITYLLRFGGLILADKFPKQGRFHKFMEALPGTILISLIIPGILANGIIGIVAAVVTAIYTIKFKNIFIAMFLGVLIVAVYRNIY